jgi:hypothetical protein
MADKRLKDNISQAAGLRRWTPDQIRAARIAPLVPLLEISFLTSGVGMIGAVANNAADAQAIVPTRF